MPQQKGWNVDVGYEINTTPPKKCGFSGSRIHFEFIVTEMNCAGL
jgi:hypothetical protein